MPHQSEYPWEDPLFSILRREDQDYLKGLSRKYRLTFQEMRLLKEMAADFAAWGGPTLADTEPDLPENLPPPEKKRRIFGAVKSRWNSLKEAGPDYAAPRAPAPGEPRPPGEDAPAADSTILLGPCPVASEKTRCCNLLTLDAVLSCGFDCSYCTIQSFYSGGKIRFHSNLDEKLKALEKELDPGETYHIGTGQSSDSLMWGNRRGILSALFGFAERNPNVILELKTKSDNVEYLIASPPPPNVLVTWTMNTGTIISREERGTASLDRRLAAAKKTARRGIPVGFHFHPLIRYARWEDEYRELFRRVMDEFSPDEVVMASLGTLTYIKPVIKKIRLRGLATGVLQMPLEETAGKFSYPYGIKKELFSLAWDSLAGWREKVFLYFCMEDPELWKDTAGYDYGDNRRFEAAMKESYKKKCLEIAKRKNQEGNRK